MKLKITFSTLFLFFNLLCFGNQNMNINLKTQFEDNLKAIFPKESLIEIHFYKYAAIYKLKKDHPHFENLKNILEKNVGKTKKLKITAIMPKMEIEDISEI